MNPRGSFPAVATLFDRGYGGSPFILVPVLAWEAPSGRTPGVRGVGISLLRLAPQRGLLHARKYGVVDHGR